ncbi:MAG: peptidase M61, partial [Sphingobacteriales bacterium]
MKKLVYRILIQTAFILLFFVFKSDSQNSYKYSVNLNKVTNDELKVELIAPKISKPEIIFYLPKIVPGTYNISDFGKFIHNVKAYDKLGKLLPVMQLDTNSWKIKKANQLYKLVYDVEDSWDSKLKHDVYSMAGTNFEEGENFSINTCGLFGYFDGMKKIPFE